MSLNWGKKTKPHAVVVAMPRVCPARAVGMNEHWQFCLGAGLGTVATGNCTAWLREAVPLQNRVPTHDRGLELRDLWGIFWPKQFCNAVKAPLRLGTSLGWWGHAPSIITKCHLLDFDLQQHPGFFFWDLLWAAMFLPSFLFLKKSLFRTETPQSLGFLHGLCFSLHRQLSVPEQQQWLGFEM